MKKISIVIIAAFAFIGSLRAQENAVKANPIGLLFGAAQFGYEHLITEKSSLELSLAYANIGASVDGEDSRATGLGIDGRYKFYFSPSKVGIRGWYAAPTAGYVSTKATSSNSEGKLSWFSAGAVGGYQWIFGGGSTGFALDLNFGAQYVSAKTSGDISGVTIDGLLPKLGVSLGYAW